MTAPWQPIFVVAGPSQTILSIDRSEPRFESHTGGKIRKTLKNNEAFDVFFVIFKLNQVRNCSVQIKKMKDRISSFQMKEKLLLSNVNRQC